jgi:hypothetical protein
LQRSFFNKRMTLRFASAGAGKTAFVAFSDPT